MKTVAGETVVRNPLLTGAMVGANSGFARAPPTPGFDETRDAVFAFFFPTGPGLSRGAFSERVFLAATRCADEYRIRNTDLKALLSSLWQRRYTGRGVSQLISPGAVAFAGPPGFHHYDVPPDVATAGQAGGRERDDSRVPPSCAPQPANPTVSSFFSCSYGGVRSVTVSRCDRARRR